MPTQARIIDETVEAALAGGDYVLIDSSGEGTRKFDLGALAASIDEDISTLEEKTFDKGTLPDQTDLDGVVDMGYYLLASGNTYTHKPNGMNNLLVLRSSTTSNTIYQLGGQASTGYLWQRFRTNATTWTDWSEFWPDSFETFTCADAGSYYDITRQNCYAIGKRVFVSLELSVTTANPPTSADVAVIPSGYRPASNLNSKGFVARENGGNVKNLRPALASISTSGAVRQSLSSAFVTGDVVIIWAEYIRA